VNRQAIPPAPDAVDCRFRVRYAETDQMGVVHNSNYLVWFEMGRTEYCDVRGYPYRRMEEEGIMMVVAESRIRYKRPAHYDDFLVVRTRISRSTPRVVNFAYELFRESTGELIADGETVHVPVDRTTRRPTHMPREILETLTA
jgi:acyl-CoA thioester hydrolase